MAKSDLEGGGASHLSPGGPGLSSDLRDAEWTRLEPFIAMASPGWRRPKTDLRAAMPVGPAWASYGATPKQSRPTARRTPSTWLATISQLIGPASRHFFRVGQKGPTPPESRDSPRCDAASRSFGSKVWFTSCPVSKRLWPKPKRV